MLAIPNPRSILTTCLLLLTLGSQTRADDADPFKPEKPIMLRQSGGFTIGGKIIQAPFNPNMTLSCDHGYVEYFHPWRPRKTSIVMWHSSSTQTFQNRWDGGEGFKDKFLRRDYPVYLWDGPRVGRANWACNVTYYVPDYRDQGNFAAWNFGPSFKNWWPGVQFPTENEYAWQQATSSRYVEYDSEASVHLETNAAAIAADSGKLGKSIVYLGNSASGLRAQMTAVKSNSTNIKGIVCYEGYGYVFPDTAGIRPGAGNNAFGPIIVPEEDWKKLTKIPIQFLWGDNRDESFTFLNQSRQAAALINKHGGNAEVILLGKDKGLKGTTHIAFADMHNEKVADLLEDFLRKNKLSRYERDE
ncbi:alpha/beta-hydrolase [Canariomyces notabilis]|uniref:Alpha/beta-hydrolase n=1 Tax=Canariomyces notabilis TaxID=2074819 RepID=A0AAN6QFC2_9PEZI|nr:alpha/beta-hydrolase [Canariomyces arenarius]